MSATKKLQLEMDKMLKDCRALLDLYDLRWNHLKQLSESTFITLEDVEKDKGGLRSKKKVGNRPQTQELMDLRHNTELKNRLKGELETTLKKLHKCRQTLNNWSVQSEQKATARSREELHELKRELELRYKRGKVFYLRSVSSESVSQDSTLLKLQTEEWFTDSIHRLSDQVEVFQAEVDDLRRSNPKDERADQLAAVVDTHMNHISKLENILRAIRNGTLPVEEIAGGDEDDEEGGKEKEENGKIDEDEEEEKRNGESDTILARLKNLITPYIDDNKDFTVVIDDDLYEDLGLGTYAQEQRGAPPLSVEAEKALREGRNEAKPNPLTDKPQVQMKISLVPQVKEDVLDDDWAPDDIYEPELEEPAPSTVAETTVEASSSSAYSWGGVSPDGTQDLWQSEEGSQAARKASVQSANAAKASPPSPVVSRPTVEMEANFLPPVEVVEVHSPRSSLAPPISVSKARETCNTEGGEVVAENLDVLTKLQKTTAASPIADKRQRESNAREAPTSLTTSTAQANPSRTSSLTRSSASATIKPSRAPVATRVASTSLGGAPLGSGPTSSSLRSKGGGEGDQPPPSVSLNEVQKRGAATPPLPPAVFRPTTNGSREAVAPKAAKVPKTVAAAASSAAVARTPAPRNCHVANTGTSGSLTGGVRREWEGIADSRTPSPASPSLLDRTSWFDRGTMDGKAAAGGLAVASVPNNDVMASYQQWIDAANAYVEREGRTPQERWWNPAGYTATAGDLVDSQYPAAAAATESSRYSHFPHAVLHAASSSSAAGPLLNDDYLVHAGIMGLSPAGGTLGPSFEALGNGLGHPTEVASPPASLGGKNNTPGSWLLAAISSGLSGGLLSNSVLCGSDVADFPLVLVRKESGSAGIYAKMTWNGLTDMMRVPIDEQDIDRHMKGEAQPTSSTRPSLASRWESACYGVDLLSVEKDEEVDILIRLPSGWFFGVVANSNPRRKGWLPYFVVDPAYDSDNLITASMTTTATSGRRGGDNEDRAKVSAPPANLPPLGGPWDFRGYM